VFIPWVLILTSRVSFSSLIWFKRHLHSNSVTEIHIEMHRQMLHVQSNSLLNVSMITPTISFSLPCSTDLQFSTSGDLSFLYNSVRISLIKNYMSIVFTVYPRFSPFMFYFILSFLFLPLSTFEFASFCC
jgi:hypothetical protein